MQYIVLLSDSTWEGPCSPSMAIRTMKRTECMIVPYNPLTSADILERYNQILEQLEQSLAKIDDLSKLQGE